MRVYLEALAASRPKRGRKRTPESIKKRLDRIEVELAEATPIQRLHLVQERMDLERELASSSETFDLSELEAAFVGAAKGYSERKGISYAAWREAGVPAATLKAAGISRGR